MSQASTIDYDGQPGGYQPGVCNIGPAEIARRRRVGHIGVIATILLFGLLVVLDLPPITVDESLIEDACFKRGPRYASYQPSDSEQCSI